MADELQPEESDPGVKMSNESAKDENMPRLSDASKSEVTEVREQRRSTQLRSSKDLRDSAKISQNLATLPIIPPINNFTINLLSVTEEERNILLRVLDKDDQFMGELDARTSLLRKEILILRKLSLAAPEEKDPTDVSRKCIRCRRQFGKWRAVVPMIDKGMICQRCKFRVCRRCSHKQANGLRTCSLCVRYSEIQQLTGSWVDKGGGGLMGTEIMRISLKDTEYYRHKLLLRAQKRAKKHMHEKRERAKRKAKHKSKKKKKKQKKEKEKDKQFGKKKGSVKAKGKKQKDKGGKSQKPKGGKLRPKSKPGKPKAKAKAKAKTKGKAKGKGKGKVAKKKKAGKDKSKNANEQHENTDVSYSHRAEHAREVAAENDIDTHNLDVGGVDTLASELQLFSQKKSHASSRRRVRPCDQHLRWQDESKDTTSRRDNGCGAQGDSNIGDTSGQPILLEKKNTNRRTESTKTSSSIDANVPSSGDHTSEVLQEERKHRHSDTHKKANHKHRTHKTRRRSHDKFNSDYTLNENKDIRNLQASDMIIDDRDHFVPGMVQFVASQIHLIKTLHPVVDYNHEEVVCKKRVSINSLQTANVPMRSHYFVDTEHSLRASSEHCFKTAHTNPDLRTQTMRKQCGSKCRDDTYTLNTEVPDGEWEKQSYDPDDSAVNTQNKRCMPAAESNSLDAKLTGDDEQCVVAVPVDIRVHDTQGSPNITRENLVQPHHDDNADLLAGESSLVNQPLTVSMEANATSSPNTSQVPPVEEDQRQRPFRSKKLFSSFRNNKLLKRVKSVFANIVDPNTPDVGKFARITDRNENYKVHKIAQYTDAPAPTRQDSMEVTNFLKAGGYVQQDKPQALLEKPESIIKTKSKYSLGEVMIKAKQQQVEQQKRLTIIERAKAPQFTKESQTEYKRSLGSKLCPFCRVSIEFGIPA